MSAKYRLDFASYPDQTPQFARTMADALRIARRVLLADRVYRGARYDTDCEDRDWNGDRRMVEAVDLWTSRRQAEMEQNAPAHCVVSRIKATPHRVAQTREPSSGRKPYHVGSGWLVVLMNAAEARGWNNSTLPLADLDKLRARRSDETRYRTLGEMLDLGQVSRDEWADQAHR